MRVLRVVGLLAVMLVARVGYATPIAYSEVASGDLPFVSPFMQFTLDVGANTIAGENVIATQSLDVDSFAFVVPLGMHVSNVTFAFVTTAAPGTNLAHESYALDLGNPPSTGLKGFSIDLLAGGSPLQAYGSALPLGAGTYSVLNGIFVVGGDPGIDHSATTDYIWTIDVASDAPEAVPEPASLCLLGTCLIGMSVPRWRNRRHLR
jgi:hypothetical protein